MEEKKVKPKTESLKTICVLQTKGGSSKSTTAYQVIASYFLARNKPVNLLEFDDENKDSAHFTNSKISTKQIEVGTGENMNDILRDVLLEDNNCNLVLDVGGNKTTSIFIENLKKTRLDKKIDLFVIPMSGGSQDFMNAVKTYNLIKDSAKKVVFCLSRVRNIKRVYFQYSDFFTQFSDSNFFILTESDVIDLSREQKKSVFEISLDNETKKEYEKALDQAFDEKNNDLIRNLSIILEIFDDSQRYVKDVLTPIFTKLDSLTQG